MTYREMTREFCRRMGYATEGPEFDGMIEMLSVQSGVPANTQIADAEKRIRLMVQIETECAKNPEFAQRTKVMAKKMVSERIAEN